MFELYFFLKKKKKRFIYVILTLLLVVHFIGCQRGFINLTVWMLRKCWKIKKFENWGLLVGWGMGNERLYSIMIIIRSGFKK